MILPPLAVMSLWYAVPLIVSVSLVCAASRHELMRPIVEHGVRFSVGALAFLGFVVGVISLLEWMA
jgi:hypothetical protein